MSMICTKGFGAYDDRAQPALDPDLLALPSFAHDGCTFASRLGGLFPPQLQVPD